MGKKFPARLLMSALILALFAITAQAFDFKKLKKSITEITLDNGLRVIIMERHDAPVASFLTWADVGSADDPKGYTGLAHMFEHMAFKGTTTLGTKNIEEELKLIAVEDSIFMELRAEKNMKAGYDSARVASLTEAYEAAREASFELVEPNKFLNVVEREGGVGLNAFTNRDATVYYFSLPSNKVELWLAMESERFLNPVLREMYKERDVVAEERRMSTESSPVGKLVEEFLAIAFKTHPYGIPTIGHISDINYYSRNEAKDFFQKYYGPSNLTVCIVGDVNTKEVIKLVKKYWDRIEYRPKPERIATVEPEQNGERRVTVEDASQPIYIAGWHVPSITHPDRPALDALTDYLGQGRTSLLYKNLVKEKKAATQVGAFAGFPGDKYPTLVAVYAFVSTGHTNQECETEIFKEIEKIKNELLTPQELAGIKARAKAAFINQLNSNTGFALQLAGTNALWGDWREMFNDLDRINQVTAEDIQRVAKEYFIKRNRVVGMIETTES